MSNSRFPDVEQVAQLVEADGLPLALEGHHDVLARRERELYLHPRSKWGSARRILRVSLLTFCSFPFKISPSSLPRWRNGRRTSFRVPALQGVEVRVLFWAPKLEKADRRSAFSFPHRV